MSTIATIKPKSHSAPAFATPENLEQAMKLAEMMAKSDLVPKDYKGKPGNCLIAMQMGAELGLPPMQAIQNIAVVNGRPAVWGDAIIGLVRASGLCEFIKEDVIEDDQGRPIAAVCIVKRQGEPEQTRTFTVEMAKTAGLWGRNTWAQYPARMLQMRARSWALRDVFPDVLKGLHVAEEVMDIPAEKDITPDEGAASTTERVKSRLLSRQQEEPEQVDIDQLIKEMVQAQTVDELRAVAAKAKHLPTEEDKQRARECYKDALEMLKDPERGAPASNRAEPAGKNVAA